MTNADFSSRNAIRMEIVKDWNRALLYTGQGIEAEDITKFVSRFKEVDHSSVLEGNIAVAERVSGLPIARYMVDPRDIFNNNIALQMVVHTLNVSSGDLALEKLDTTEDLVGAGHSLGEAGAMDAAGVYPNRQSSMEFVFERASDMQKAYKRNPGTLYLLMGLNEDNAVNLPAELEVDLALINGPQLTVVASDIGRFAEIEAEAKKAGARKVIDLKIPPFHTRRMLQARVDLEAFARAEGREFRTAIFPIVSNYDGEEGLDGYGLVIKHITSVTNPVRWTDVIRRINHPGVTFYTMGPGTNPADLNKANKVPAEQTKDLFQLLAE